MKNNSEISVSINEDKPIFKIDSIDGNMITCSWFDNTGEEKTSSFELASSSPLMINLEGQEESKRLELSIRPKLNILDIL